MQVGPVLTLKTLAYVGDGPIKVAVLHVHEQPEPITLKMGDYQKHLLDSGVRAVPPPEP